MEGLLELKDMYEVVLSDMKNLELDSSKGRFLDILNQKLPPRYRRLRCFFYETDYEHHFEYFLTEIEDVLFGIDTEGLKIFVKFNELGRYVRRNGIFYQLVKNKVNREDFNRLLMEKIQEFGRNTYQKKSEIEILPKKCRNDALYTSLFLIHDGEGFLKKQNYFLDFQCATK